MLLLYENSIFARAKDVPPEITFWVVLGEHLWQGMVSKIPRRRTWVLFEGERLLGPNRRMDTRYLTVPVRVQDLLVPQEGHHSHFLFSQEVSGLRAIMI